MSESFLPDFIYPLKEPTRFDDEYGEGYSYALVADEDPGECFIVDCWIVNQQGEKHPGLDASPVPISAESVEIDEGEYFTNLYGRGDRTVRLMAAKVGM